MENNKTILIKIKKLLALSGSPNENEASVAMCKAQELLKEHNLSMAEVKDFNFDKPDKFEAITGRKIPRWKQHLFASIATVFNCIPIIEGYTGENKSRYFFGKEVDAITAKIIFDYLSATIEREGEKVSSKGTKFKNSFKLGMTVRIIERLQEKHKQQKKYGNGEYGLLVVNNKKFLDRELSNIGNYKTRSIIGGSFSDAAGLNAGLKKGSDIGLDQQVGKNKYHQNLLS